MLEKLAIAQVQVPCGVVLYKSELEAKPLPSPQWGTLVTLIDSKVCKLPSQELDPSLVKWVTKKSKGWDLAYLTEEVKKYPKVSMEECMEREVQTEGLVEVPSSPPVSPISFSPQGPQDLFLSAELSLEVDVEFTKEGFKPPSVSQSVEDLPLVPSLESHREETRGIPVSRCLVSKDDLQLLAEDLFQHIQVEEKVKSTPFHKETENLQGDLEGDLSRFDGDPKLKALLEKYVDIFGPLHPPVPVVNWCNVILNSRKSSRGG